MHVVYEAENLIDAHLLRGRLAAEGIKAFVRGDYLAGAMGELPLSGLIAVWVIEDDAPLARQLIDEWQAQLPDPADAGDDRPDDDPFFASSVLA